MTQTCSNCAARFDFPGYRLYLDPAYKDGTPGRKDYMMKPVCPNCGKPPKYYRVIPS